MSTVDEARRCRCRRRREDRGFVEGGGPEGGEGGREGGREDEIRVGISREEGGHRGAALDYSPFPFTCTQNNRDPLFLPEE